MSTTATIELSTLNPLDPNNNIIKVKVSALVDPNKNVVKLDIPFRVVTVTPDPPDEDIVTYVDQPIAITATMEDLKELARKLDLILA